MWRLRCAIYISNFQFLFLALFLLLVFNGDIDFTNSTVDRLNDVIAELKHFIFGSGVMVLCGALFQLQQVNYYSFN